MNNCPNCLASNPFKKVYKDGLVIVKCEYCNTIFEDTSTKKSRVVSERVRNEVQNKASNETDFLSLGMFTLMKKIAIVVALALVVAVGTFYIYTNIIDSRYEKEEFLYGFPVPKDVEIKSKSKIGSVSSYIITWDRVSGKRIPIDYKLIIMKNGWKIKKEGDFELDGIAYHAVKYKKEDVFVSMVIRDPDSLTFTGVSDN
ncbi:MULTISPECIES: hypothetical protein [Lysinibacillus]|jgi:hypothetical protein|uniref:hypothetical protein n=1 Tax=Lysinibacillus TaxID=400634 RepID=UPI0005683AEB|nr:MULTISPECIES: hypothetical protein [Lysinibacillus]AJK87603.1 hypothetical protein HR49_10720 [Lysinibacillus fusiformis]KHK48831.1 hypothetical protein PI85_22100 [Lysinibacillus sp. A1]